MPSLMLIRLKISGLEENVADQFAAYYTLEFPYEDDPENYIGKDAMHATAWDYWLISEQYPDLPHPLLLIHTLLASRVF